MRTFLDILALGRSRRRDFLLIALLVSLGSAATLAEPWIYRAIIDDIAGVFIAPPVLLEAETWLERLTHSLQHLRGSWARMFAAPLVMVTTVGSRVLEGRTVPQAMATVIVGALLLGGLKLLSEWFRLLADNRMATVASDIERHFILRIYRHVTRLPLAFFTRRSSAALARQVDQSDNVAPVFAAAAQQFWPDFFGLTAILTILVIANRQLALIAAIAIVAYALVTWRSSRRLETALERYYALWDDVSSHIQESIAGIKTVQAHGNEAYEATRLDDLSRRAYDTYVERNQLANRYVYMQEAIVAVAKTLVLLLGGLKAIEHQLTPGDVVMFLAYLDRLFTPIENLTGLYTQVQQHGAAVRRAQRLLEEATVVGDERPPLAPGDGDVRFDAVSFGYSARRVLDQVSFHLRPGERTALIGPSGAGKTTITDLLVGLYTPQSGQILVAGQRLADVSPSSVRAAIRGVAADGTLFRTSILENIRYGRLDAGDDEVRDAASMAGLDPVIERLEDGFDTLIGERGVELSVGERQRVLLARAFVGHPTVLVLDEATANLDFRTEASVKEALARLSRGRTTLLIAHRPSMLHEVDRVIVLRNGRIEQDGPPAALLNRDGYFRDMMQASESS